MGTSKLTDIIIWSMQHIGFNRYSKNNKMHWVAIVGTICFIVINFLLGIEAARANNTTRLFESFGVFSFATVGLLKLYSLWQRRRNWVHVIREIKTLERNQMHRKRTLVEDYESDNECEDICTYIKEYTENFVTTSKVLGVIYAVTVTLFVSSPIIEYGYTRLIIKDRSRNLHVLPCWSPFDNKSVFGYMIQLFIEIIGAIFCVAVHAAFDVTSVGVMIFSCGQFTYLRHYSQNVGGKGKWYNIDTNRDNRALCRIRHCHQMHLCVVNLIKYVGQLLKNILGIYFFLVTCTVCSVAVRLSTEVLSIMEIISLVQYLSGTLTQLFLFCYYGDAVLNESSVGMSQGPYGAAYWCLSPKVRHSLLLLAVGMSQPHKFQVGLFHTLDLPSFSMIIRAAYSFYAVLRQ